MNESSVITRDIRVSTDNRFKAWMQERHPRNPHNWECDSCAFSDVPAYLAEAWDAAIAEDAEHYLPSGNVTILPENKALPAEAQAELLGATADQRAKLRAIITARVTAERRVEELNREVQRLTNEQVEPSDRRVWALFGRAAAEADRQEYCNVYDQISSAVGIPNRDELRSAGYLPQRSYDVEVTVSLSVSTTITVEADDEDDADSQVRDMSNRDIWEYLDLSGADHYAIDSFETGEVTEVDD